MFNAKRPRSGFPKDKLLSSVLFLLVLQNELGAEVDSKSSGHREASPSLASALPWQQWQEVEKSIDRALSWMAQQQSLDGSFPTLISGQPAVTSLSIMAFLSRGHQPGIGLYGQQINRAIDFTISCQLPSGLISLRNSEFPDPSSFASTYNHAISGLMLGEVYGQISGSRAKAAKQAIEHALDFSRRLQLRRKPAEEKGGWRYVTITPAPGDSDLSVTSWQLMFLRSARNAEFNVPQGYVDEAMDYVKHLFDPGTGMFYYKRLGGVGVKPSRGLAGAGILSLSMGGYHQSSMALKAGDWLLSHPYRRFGDTIGEADKFFYSTYYCSQAMAQLGGKYWREFFPDLVKVLLSSQQPDGSWPAEFYAPQEAAYGNVYTTAMAVLSLTPPYQLLPVYQR
jgi:hypothetical protein